MSKDPNASYDAIQSALMKWYDSNARTLPWRESRDPYRIWVSEIMLQQTQVKTALPYYERFIEAFPNAAALAAAEESRVLKLWEGLGYYSRVRNMQKAARIMVEEYEGLPPASFEQLLKLPGIGAYSAGAVASIAFGQAVPAVDGNVLRVFSRLFGSIKDISDPAVKREFQAIAVRIQPKERPGDFNQALMELGAVVCLPNGAPLCGACPLLKLCRAYAENTTDQIPCKSAKVKRKTEKRTILVITSESKILLHKRERKGLLAGMVEPVNLEGWLSREQVHAYLAAKGMDCVSLEKTVQAKHLFTHIEWQMEGYKVYTSEIEPPEGFFWADIGSIVSEHAIPSAFKAFMKNIG